jgi:hypothetical protein
VSTKDPSKADDTTPAEAEVPAAPPAPPAPPTRKQVYEQHLLPHLRAICEVCQQHGIGMLAAFDLDDTPNDPTTPGVIAHSSLIGPTTNTALHYATMAIVPPPGMSMQPTRAPMRGFGSYEGKPS